MKVRRLCFFLFFILFMFSFSKISAQGMETLFYVVDSEDSFQSYKKNVGSISLIAPQTYKLDEHGILWGSADPRIIELAKKNGVKVMPLVVNPGFNQAMFHKLLLDPQAQSIAIRSMVEECKRQGYTGMQFDFENVHVTDKDAFRGFYQLAAEAFHSSGLAISIAVVPRTGDFPGSTDYSKWIFENWRGVYDYKALSEAGDFISLMTYDQHTHRTTPGPVAGIPWMEAVLQFVLTEVAPEKISLGIPLYSTYWYPYAQGDQVHAWGRSVSFLEAKGLADRFKAGIQWDDREKTSWVVYQRDGLNEYLYVEDARALQPKLDLVKKYKLRGVSAWRLGQEDPQIWSLLTNLGR